MKTFWNDSDIKHQGPLRLYDTNALLVASRLNTWRSRDHIFTTGIHTYYQYKDSFLFELPNGTFISRCHHICVNLTWIGLHKITKVSTDTNEVKTFCMLHNENQSIIELRFKRRVNLTQSYLIRQQNTVIWMLMKLAKFIVNGQAVIIYRRWLLDSYD